MKRILLLFYIFSSFGITAQDKVRVDWNFNNSFQGKSYIDSQSNIEVDSAIFLGNRIVTSKFLFSSDSVLSLQTEKCPHANFEGAAVKASVISKSKWPIKITKVVARQSAAGNRIRCYYKLGISKGKRIPDIFDNKTTSDSVPFFSYFSEFSFIPSGDIALVFPGDTLNVLITARGERTATFDWNIDKLYFEAEEQNSEVNFNVNIGAKKQLVRFGVDAERLWYWRSSLKKELAEIAVKELKANYVRVAVNPAYEREEGVKNISEYSKILEMMKAIREANPEIDFFASPRPLEEAYNNNEKQTIWGGKVPWAPYPAWINVFVENGTKIEDGVVITNWKLNEFKFTKLPQYYADYLNLMHDNGIEIKYLDVVNEWGYVKPSHVKYLYEQLPALLNEGVKMPKLVVASSWSMKQGTDWLLSVNSKIGEDKCFDIVSCHNTGEGGTYAGFANQGNKMGKEVWNSEMHTWVGIDKETEILNSKVLWEHMRAGFTGIDTWLFYGPYEGKDHTMIWSSNSSIQTSSKYEIYKRLVNYANMGNYLNISIPAQNTITSAFIKDSIISVWILNSGNLKLDNVKFAFSEYKIQNCEVASIQYSNAFGRYGFTSRFEALDSTSFVADIQPKSLYCFKIDLGKKISGIKSEIQGRYSLFPNPTKESFRIMVPEGYPEQFSLEIFNVSGQKVYGKMTSQGEIIDVSNWTSGVYLVRFLSGNKLNHQRLVVD